MTFDEALNRAHSVICGDMEGLFTCHTVDPYVDALEKAHREEIARLQAVLDKVRELASVDTPKIRTPWYARGRHIFDDTEDAGALELEFEDVDADETAKQTAEIVNRFADIRKLMADLEQTPEAHHSGGEL